MHPLFLSVLVGAAIVFVIDLAGAYIEFNNRFVNALVDAILFAIVFGVLSYLGHDMMAIHTP